MRTIFADTGYWVAVVNPRDSLHRSALATAARLGDYRIVTSELVLVEVLNMLSSYGPPLRGAAVELAEMIGSDKGIELVAQSAPLFRDAVALYRGRPDKGWSLTDCASFLIMEQRQILEALTADAHFQQYGFRALLRD
jgi:predicted nucleic acid-binding protein